MSASGPHEPFDTGQPPVGLSRKQANGALSLLACESQKVGRALRARPAMGPTTRPRAERPAHRVWLAAALFSLLPCAPAAPARAEEELFDRVASALTFSAAAGQARAHLSGSLDLEGYRTQLPAPGVLETRDGSLLEPRLTAYLDAQFGPHVYLFAQARADHGFDPGERSAEARIDEFALRFAPGPRRELNLQVGRFATVVGNWATRHDSWTNPFITAPMPYEHLTGVWDTEAIRTSNALLQWSHVRPGLPDRITANEKSFRLPIVWGPSYADGVMLSDAIGRFRYAVEAKLGSLSSRPEAWRHGREQRHHPTVSTRITYRPSPTWQVGASASTGAYLREFAARTMVTGHNRGDYRQTVIAGDATYAWRHWQLWAEAYAARFAIPVIGNADTIAYYTEAKYRFTPQFSAALRWNEQRFASIADRGGRTRWGKNATRLDLAPGYRLSPHTQLKLQYSLQHGDSGPRAYTRLLATQLTTRF